jgi:type II secretory pathway pseudopilin PulG
MIGVLAVIAILASMLVPKVFEAINTARITSSIVSCEAVKAAAADHYGKYGKFDLLFGTNVLNITSNAYSGYDVTVLMAEGLLDKAFSARIAGPDPSVNSFIQLVAAGSGNYGGPSGIGYFLDGVTAATTGAQFVLEAVMQNVSAADAKDLNDRVDGAGLGGPAGVADHKGRVEFEAGATTTVYVYLTHR